MKNFRSFNDEAELSLTKNDLSRLLQDALNDKLFNLGMDPHEITNLDIATASTDEFAIRIRLKVLRNDTAG